MYHVATMCTSHNFPCDWAIRVSGWIHNLYSSPSVCFSSICCFILTFWLKKHTQKKAPLHLWRHSMLHCLIGWTARSERHVTVCAWQTNDMTKDLQTGSSSSSWLCCFAMCPLQLITWYQKKRVSASVSWVRVRVRHPAPFPSSGTSPNRSAAAVGLGKPGELTARGVPTLDQVGQLLNQIK